jgi:hypothetical protein
MVHDTDSVPSRGSSSSLPTKYSALSYLTCAYYNFTFVFPANYLIKMQIALYLPVR